jgi:hypothetical protein
LSGAAAHRLLDGGDDGPPPLAQLLAAATAPATAAELQGEAAARAAFRSAAHTTPAQLGSPRRRVGAKTAAIVTTKIIVALALTAGTAGGVALATNSSSHLQQNPEGDATVRSPGTEAPSRGPTGRCEALCTARTTEGSATPSGRPAQLTGNPRAGNDDEAAAKKKTGNGTHSAKEKNANNGNAFGKEKNGNNGKGSDKGGSSDGVKNSNKKDDDGGGRPSGSRSGRAGAEKASGRIRR